MVDKWLVETDLSDEWDFYTRANVGEVFPDPVAPLSFFYFQHDDPDATGSSAGGDGIPQRLLPHRRDDARRAARRRVRVPRDHRRLRLPQRERAADARSPRAGHDGQGHRRRVLRGRTRRAGVRGEARLRPTGADREDRRDVRLGAHHTRPARRAGTRADWSTACVRRARTSRRCPTPNSSTTPSASPTSTSRCSSASTSSCRSSPRCRSGSSRRCATRSAGPRRC